MVCVSYKRAKNDVVVIEIEMFILIGIDNALALNVTFEINVYLLFFEIAREAMRHERSLTDFGCFNTVVMLQPDT